MAPVSGVFASCFLVPLPATAFGRGHALQRPHRLRSPVAL